jgi:Amt family ammonium transporter
MRRKVPFSIVMLAIVMLLAGAGSALAQDTTLAELAEQVTSTRVAVDTVWTLLAAVLVFFMNLGFGMVESGLARAKNTVNICAKNFIVFAAASLSFYVIGWGLMFGDGTGFIGTHGLWFVGGADNSPLTGDAYSGVYGSIGWAGVPLWCKFFFQLVFAGTAATIVSGAVAERVKFISFIVFSFILVAFIYPITGHWIWGGGWLASFTDTGFWDFAGSTVVHSVGGWCALVGAIVLGPRIGKYSKEGAVQPMPGHSMTSVMLGVLILWFGWFGFNPGSTMAADGAAISHIAVTTNMAAAAALLSATATAWILLEKPDFSMMANGALAGLVAITAPCAFVTVGASVIIGLIAGVLVVYAVLFFDRVHVDDPVGATSVHLVCGIWGTLSIGLFGTSAAPGGGPDGLFYGGGIESLYTQFVGVVAVGALCVVTSAIAWVAIKAVLGMRVSPEEEAEGLDWGEHGVAAYPDFQTSSIGVARRH